MADRKRDYSKELADVMNAMAESTLDITDEEIESEIREEGGDPDAVAERARDVMRRAIKASQQRPLLEAQKRYEERAAALTVKKYRMPDRLEDQRKMISSILAANPQFGAGLLTAQFRDFEALPDEEVECFLRQLLELVETSG